MYPVYEYSKRLAWLVVIAAWLFCMGVVFIGTVKAAEPNQLTINCETVEQFTAKLKAANVQGADLKPAIHGVSVDNELLIFYFAKDGSAILLKTKDQGKSVCTIAIVGNVDIDIANLFRNTREASETE